MKDENLLVNFLYDYPWTSSSVLKSVFGPCFEKLARPKETRSIQIPGVGTCWGINKEKLSSVPGIRRREQAKRYLIGGFNKAALWNGSSPGPWGSDLLAKTGNKRNRWVRVWVDNEGAEVAALPFLHPVPARCAPNLLDLIITGTGDRAKLIHRHLNLLWSQGNRKALIYYQNRDEPLRLEKYQYGPKKGSGGIFLDDEEVLKAVSAARLERLENIRHDQVVGKYFLDLSEIDFVLLKYVGDNPLFSLDELSTLIASSSTGRPLFTRSKAKERADGRFKLLSEKGLIENAAAPLAGIKPSALGLEVLAGYWGVSKESMKRFQSWPQKQSRSIGTTYSEGALSHIGDHTRLVQQFVFGLLDNAWRLQEEHGGVDVYLDTLVGKPIYFQDLASGKTDWSIPDASIELGFWRRTWRDGIVHDPKITFSDARVLLEVDRATNPIHRLSNRMKKYGRIWRSLSGNPVQVWIIDGTPWREKEILKMLEDAGINGWTVLFERLVLEKGDPWWDRFSHKEGTLRYSKHRGMAPLRKIWRRAGDYDMHYLMDHAPWERKMSQSKPIVKGPRGY